MKNQYIGGNCLKRQRLGQFADLRGAWQKEGGVFEGGGVDIPMHAMVYSNLLVFYSFWPVEKCGVKQYRLYRD